MQALAPLDLPLLPERLVSSAWLQHAPFAYWIVDALRPRLIVELGSHNGYSFCCFCHQLQRSHVNGRAIAVDTWRGDEHAGAYNDEVYNNLSAYAAARYPGLAELKRMYFSEALGSVADNSVDLLHVDGRHFYDDVKEDFVSWIPKLSERAVVLFHDTQVRDHGFGVYQYWAELEAQYPSFEFHHGHGLGVLGIGAKLPPQIETLFAQRHDPALAAKTRANFSKRGQKIAYAHMLKTLATDPIAGIRMVQAGLHKRFQKQ